MYKVHVFRGEGEWEKVRVQAEIREINQGFAAFLALLRDFNLFFDVIQ